MKNFEEAFNEAERLRLPPGMWESIAARVQADGFAAADAPKARPAKRGFFFFESAGFRIAASLLLLAVLAGIGLSKKLKAGGSAAPAVTADVVDPELLAWSADLGEMDADVQDGANWQEKFSGATER